MSWVQVEMGNTTDRTLCRSEQPATYNERSFTMRAIIAVALLLNVATQVAMAEVVYVKDGSTCTRNCGGSWATAYDEIQDAIVNVSAQNPPEIWVAAGTYSSITFDASKNGIRTLGGFDGTETMSTQRDPATNVCRIDAGGSGRAVVSTGTDATTRLSGFTITGGNLSSYDYGAGMYLRRSSLRVSDCIITGNRGTGAIGGGVAVRGGSPEFTNCRFVGNARTLACAGADIRLASVRFVNCLFVGNQAQQGGAVCHSSTDEATFINCTFANNKSTVGRGGALFDTGGSAVLRNCIMWGNSSVVPGTDVSVSVVEGTKTSITDSVVQGGFPGTGNLDATPLFVRHPNDGGDGWGDDPSTPGVDEGANDDFGDLNLQNGSSTLGWRKN